ncbi:hypothetical protein [Pseudorhodoplanes sinuspersici]|uniref:Uncharacterized protein n=1 Tax=Pseudorhodoplanes sinuspersici TaxID=1235591 RepID=A0A1W6ZMJ3_9HYPH|nr:hypothetical protein [Pseudorhodoplanes sinuspersici]ARP97994.1 hypothetical protein CAK95_02050 [Pseudorhodoplanes sinuspersici]RKE68252.1 hypothetical protein DFP91_4626 [Pseudorhodoplanes sinuspersici]
MILGLSPEGFLLLHVAVSMVGIFSGFVVMGGMYASNKLPVWTAIFLFTTILTSVTGFLFPITIFTPALAVGLLSMIILLVAVLALYIYRLAGWWRFVYVASALAALYLNLFVFIVQSFQKVMFLQHLAPKQAEPPFVITQSVVLLTCVVLGVIALWKFHPERRLQTV